MTILLTHAIMIKLGSKKLEGEPGLTRRDEPAEEKGASFNWKLEVSMKVGK